MKALILYFSGTGNTAFAARLVEQELQNSGIGTEIHSIEENFKIEPNSFDFLILGCPKYYEYPTLHFVNWIKKNLTHSNRAVPTMMFVTQVGPMPTRWNGIQKMLFKKGFRLTVAKSFPIANNMTIFSSFPETSEEKVRENIIKMRAEISELISSLINGKENIEKAGAFLGTLEKSTAVLFTKIFAAFFVKYSPSEKCTGCSLCAKKCPKGNISMKDGQPVFGNNCIFCMRCINKCPANAILYNKKQCPQMKLPNV